MTVFKVIDEAPAELQVLLELVPGTTGLYNYVGRPDILFKEIPDGKSITQYGGLASLKLHSGGAISVAGLAGKSVRYGIANMTRKLHFPLTSENLVPPQGVTPYALMSNGLYDNVAVSELTHQELTWTEPTAVVDELQLAWICPAEYGTMFMGEVGADSTTVTLTEPTIALMQRVPIEITWTRELLAQHEDNVASGDADVDEFLIPNYYEEFEGKTNRYDMPMLVIKSADVLEIGACYSPVLDTLEDTGTVTAEQVAENNGQIVNYTRMFHITMGSLIGEFLVPRCHNTNWTKVNGYEARVMIAPPPARPLVTWPETIEGRPARQVLGHLLPGIYAPDSEVVKSGDMSMPELFLPLAPVDISNGLLDETKVDGVTTDVKQCSMPGASQRSTNVTSFGGDLLSVLAARTKDINDRTEEDIRDSSWM